MAVAYGTQGIARVLEWDLGSAAPGSRRSPLDQAGSGLAALARVLKKALTRPADRGLNPERTGR